MLAMNRKLHNGLGMPAALVWCWAGTLAMNLGLNYLWVPGWGIIGAAIASTLGKKGLPSIPLGITP